MKKYYFLIIVALILGLILTSCSLLSNISQVPATEQSGITYLTKGVPFFDLVGLWHFDEGSEATTVVDSSGNDNTGDIYDATPGEVGKFGNALSFDGVNDYVEVPNSASLNPTSHITVEAWFNAVAGTLTTQKTLVQKPFTSHIAPHYQYTLLLLDTTTKPKVAAFSITVGSMSYWVIAKDLSYGYGTWHHLAGTYNGTTITLYLDGTAVASESVSGTISTYDTVLQIGAYPNLSKTSTYCFKGLIDEVRIWNTALTEDQLGSVIVAMDIKPQSCPNPLNVKNQGVLPVAILGTDDFDVNDIDPSTILLDGEAPLRWAFEDVATPLETLIEGVKPCFNCTEEGPDGFLDLTLKFDTQSILSTLGFSTTVLVEEPLEIAPDDGQCVPLKLTGKLSDGTPIWGEDKVIIIRKGK